MDEEYDLTDDSSNYSMNWTEDYLNELDTSQYPFPNILWHIKDGNEVAIKTSVMLIIAIPGLYLNSVILVVLAKNKWLWSPSNFLVGNLSLIDFLTLLFCPWFMLVRDFYQNFVLKNFGCRFEGFLQASLLLANVFAVILVSYDRLAAATLPTDARITRKAAPRLIVYSWIISLLFSLPWMISREYVERQWLDYLETYCVENSYMMIYWHFIIVLLVWVPLGVMVLTYGAIMWRLERSARQLSSRGGGQLVARAKGRTLRVTACLLLADVACRVPYSILIYVRNRSNMEINWIDGYYSVLWFAASTPMYLNCAVNPLIYGFTNNRLLKAMDRTSGVAYCKFGSWCCVCASTKKKELRLQDKNTEKIFIIESTPRPNKKITRIIKNILHINADAIDLSIIPRLEEGTTKPTKITPLKVEVANHDNNENMKNDNEATKLTPLKPDDNNDKNENDATKITRLKLDIDETDRNDSIQSDSEEMNKVCESL